MTLPNYCHQMECGQTLKTMITYFKTQEEVKYNSGTTICLFFSLLVPQVPINFSFFFTTERPDMIFVHFRGTQIYYGLEIVETIYFSISPRFSAGHI